MTKGLCLLVTLSFVLTTLGAITCPVGTEAADGYRVTGPGLSDDLVIFPSTSASTVADFYEYGTNLFYSAIDTIVAENVTGIVVHNDSNSGVHSLIIVNGPPLAVQDKYVRMSVRVSNLPATAQVAVMDDPDTDSFMAFPAEGVVEATWAWKQPNSDGIAISMPQKDFCVDITILSNTYASVFNFFSNDHVIPEVGTREVDSMENHSGFTDGARIDIYLLFFAFAG